MGGGTRVGFRVARPSLAKGGRSSQGERLTGAAASGEGGARGTGTGQGSAPTEVCSRGAGARKAARGSGRGGVGGTLRATSASDRGGGAAVQNGTAGGGDGREALEA
jgi:hypothetical protein